LSDAAREVTKRTPLTLSASSLMRKSSSAFDSSDTVKGSTRCGVIQRPSGTLSTGARVTSAGATVSLAIAIATASRAARETASRLRSRVAAKPHEPPTKARIPTPYDSPLLTFVI